MDAGQRLTGRRQPRAVGCINTSERRAGRVVNYLQQACGWKPYRMLTPTGMAEADPMADNTTPQGKAQNRRVAVNVLVSKSVDGL